VSNDPNERASHWLSAGNKAFKEGRFEEAEKAYREAFKIKKGFDIAGNLGAAEMAQGKHKEAAQHLAFTLRMFPITGEPALREQMQKAYDKCRQSVGAVRVDVDVKGAQIYVDGALQGEAPLPDEVFVDPGEHVFEARLEGYQSTPQRVTAPKGAPVEILLVLTPIPKPEREPGLLPPPPPARSLLPGLVVGGVAALGFGGGIAFLAMSAGRRSDAEALRAPIAKDGMSCVSGAANFDSKRCSALQDKAQAYKTLHDTAVGAFVVGGAAAVGTAAYFLWPILRPRTSGHDDMHLTPVIGAGSGGVVASGSF
jgi:tetratricopeptide (TPR) repeat protein